MTRRILATIVATLAACDGSSSSEQHAVGTYIGGGSILFGADGCTCEGSPSVFQGDGSLTTAKQGPRFVFAAGTITSRCGDQTRKIAAVVPTGARIEGPNKVELGKTSDLFSASLVADDRFLSGEPAIEWHLGKDCEGVAEFDAVLGSQDTGGPDRTRKLVATGEGECTVIATLTTGSGEPSFRSRGFQAETLVSVE